MTSNPLVSGKASPIFMVVVSLVLSVAAVPAGAGKIVCSNGLDHLSGLDHASEREKTDGFNEIYQAVRNSQLGHAFMALNFENKLIEWRSTQEPGYTLYFTPIQNDAVNSQILAKRSDLDVVFVIKTPGRRAQILEWIKSHLDDYTHQRAYSKYPVVPASWNLPHIEL